jgi:hypothetical protein
MIRIKERAKIEDSFLDAYKILARDWLQNTHQKIRSMRDDNKRTYLTKSRYVMGRLSQIYKGDIEPGRGIDYEITRLRSLPYESFRFEQDHFIGMTNNVIAEKYGRGPNIKGKKYVALYDAGQYMIAVPYRALLTGAISSIHMIPMRGQPTQHRHPHHTGSPYDGTLRGLSSSTCWAEFAAPCQSAAQAVDVVEMFRLLRIFVGRYNDNSPLTRDMIRSERSHYNLNTHQVETDVAGFWELIQ